MQHGILSHTLADQLPHRSVAMPEIQERRQNKQIPGARMLHDKDDLYDQARHKAEKCAEVLVPDRVDPQLIIGACVANKIARASFQAFKSDLPVEIHGMFF